MRFGQTLANSVYPPWKDHYLDYAGLKRLLREDTDGAEDKPWTEDDESRFCDEILNVQLDKVAAFQESTFESLEQRAAKVGEKLRELAPEEGAEQRHHDPSKFKEIEDELESITNEINELKKYSTLNYTGFLKIVKKHDRKRGGRYKVRPLLQINLSKRPFNSEQAYAPLINKLSMMYFIVRQNIEDGEGATVPAAGGKRMSLSELPGQDQEKYTAYKFWVHPDNLLEVKTYILRRLPVLIYSEQSANQLETSSSDPTITSLYFDSPKFDLYTQKVSRQPEVSSLRLRWYGQLSDHPELFLEQKFIHEGGGSEVKKFSIKDKFVQPFVEGSYHMEKTIQKLERQGQHAEKVAEYQLCVNDIHDFIQKFDLQPILRANYTRTAFQKPLDDKVRISIDTNLAFIREDALDTDRPYRNPDSWHRTEIDEQRMEYPFSALSHAEISRFPYAILEIKVKESYGKRTPQWIQDLMSSHLVHKSPGFSKFVHGTASLFEDYVNSLPFWLSDLELDIRKDPQAAFEEAEAAKAKKAADEQLVGSYLGSGHRRASYKPAVASPVSKSVLSDRYNQELSQSVKNAAARAAEDQQADGGKSDINTTSKNYGTVSSVFPSLSLSKYAQNRRQQKVVLPPGVTKPELLIKDSGPLQVEPKVWLANERTFLKWQHISILLGTLAVSLYTAAGRNRIAEYMGICYVVIAAFAGLWGYYMHLVRRDMIVQRSGKDFDNFVGPLVVSVALMAALILNFIFKYREAFTPRQPTLNANDAVAYGLNVEDSYSSYLKV